jgi:hypothetical protein
MISAKGKKDMPPEVQAALEAIYRAADAGECELYTSQVTGEEIAPYKGKTKPAIENVYQATTKVPYSERQKLLGIHSYGDRYTWFNAPMIEDNLEWLRIRKLGLTDKDAHHVMLSSQAGCNVLLTCDHRLFHRVEVIRQEHRIRVMKPPALCEEMGWNYLR